MVLIVIGCLTAGSASSAVQQARTNSLARISAADAKHHINKTAQVLGRVVEVHKTERLVRLNLDKPFPGQPFTVVIFATKTNLFGDLDKIKGQRIEVTGTITEYREHPQIIVNSTNQLKVLEAGNSQSQK